MPSLGGLRLRYRLLALFAERRAHDGRRHVLLEVLAGQRAEAAVEALAQDATFRHEFGPRVARAELAEAAVELLAKHSVRRRESGREDTNRRNQHHHLELLHLLPPLYVGVHPS